MKSLTFSNFKFHNNKNLKKPQDKPKNLKEMTQNPMQPFTKPWNQKKELGSQSETAHFCFDVSNFVQSDRYNDSLRKKLFLSEEHILKV